MATQTKTSTRPKRGGPNIRRSKEATLKPAMRDAIIIAYEGTCQYCGDLFAHHVDHIHPVSRGGSSQPRNLILACEPCNLSKYNYILDDYELKRAKDLAWATEPLVRHLVKEGNHAVSMQTFTHKGAIFQSLMASYPLSSDWGAFAFIREQGSSRVYSRANYSLSGYAEARDWTARVEKDLFYQATQMKRTVSAATKMFDVRPGLYVT